MTETEYNNILNDCISNISIITNELIRKYTKIAADEIRELCRQAVSNFYSLYDPHYYRRTDSLRKAFKISFDENEGILKVDYSPDYMPDTHRAPTDYIFDIAFVEGYHGGSSKIAPEKEGKWGKHPNTGEMYWRQPPLVYGVRHPYTKWGRPAEQSVSPYLYIQEGFPILEREINNRLQTEYNKKMNKIVDILENATNKFYGGK